MAEAVNEHGTGLGIGMWLLCGLIYKKKTENDLWDTECDL